MNTLVLWRRRQDRLGGGGVGRRGGRRLAPDFCLPGHGAALAGASAGGALGQRGGVRMLVLMLLRAAHGAEMLLVLLLLPLLAPLCLWQVVSRFGT